MNKRNKKLPKKRKVKDVWAKLKSNEVINLNFPDDNSSIGAFGKGDRGMYMCFKKHLIPEYKYVRKLYGNRDVYHVKRSFENGLGEIIYTVDIAGDVLWQSSC